MARPARPHPRGGVAREELRGCAAVQSHGRRARARGREPLPHPRLPARRPEPRVAHARTWRRSRARTGWTRSRGWAQTSPGRSTNTSEIRARPRHRPATRREVPAGVVDAHERAGHRAEDGDASACAQGITDVDRLEKARARRASCAALPGIQAQTEQNILRGIPLVRGGQARMPLGRALPHRPRARPRRSRRVPGVKDDRARRLHPSRPRDGRRHRPARHLRPCRAR